MLSIRNRAEATFNTDIYDSKEMDTLLGRIALSGANTLRVWIWGIQNPNGFTGGLKGTGLNEAYMENVVDFLRHELRLTGTNVGSIMPLAGIRSLKRIDMTSTPKDAGKFRKKRPDVELDVSRLRH